MWSNDLFMVFNHIIIVGANMNIIVIYFQYKKFWYNNIDYLYVQ